MNVKNSSTSLDKVKKGLRAQEEVEFSFDERMLDRLHDRIMQEVDRTEMAPVSRLVSTRYLLRAHWREWKYSLGGIAALFVMATMGARLLPAFNESLQRVGLFSDGSERIVAEALSSPDIWSQTLINSQGDSDFFMDVASESFDTLTVSKVQKILGEKRRN